MSASNVEGRLVAPVASLPIRTNKVCKLTLVLINSLYSSRDLFKVANSKVDKGMLDKTSAALVIEPATWIWSKWLKLRDQSQFKYRHFTHYEFIEDEMGRSEIQDDLAKLLYSYHSSSPINTNLLAQLKYRQLASVLTRSGDMRPHDTKTRSGNLVEILACEFAKKLGYDIPILRLQYNPNPEQSMKGDDILGFQF